MDPPRVQIRVTLQRPASLYVLIDNRTPAPKWLQEQFDDTGDDVGIDGGGYTRGAIARAIDVGPGVSIDDQFSIWRRDLPAAGTVDLGAIVIGGAQNNMYGIVAVPMEVNGGRDTPPGDEAHPAGAATPTAP